LLNFNFAWTNVWQKGVSVGPNHVFMRFSDFIIMICIIYEILGVFSTFVTLHIIFLFVQIAFVIIQKRFKDIDVKFLFVGNLVYFEIF
jgi:hypothetical protein